jgi:hypothetical protein
MYLKFKAIFASKTRGPLKEEDKPSVDELMVLRITNGLISSMPHCNMSAAKPLDNSP